MNQILMQGVVGRLFCSSHQTGEGRHCRAKQAFVVCKCTDWFSAQFQSHTQAYSKSIQHNFSCQDWCCVGKILLGERCPHSSCICMKIFDASRLHRFSAVMPRVQTCSEHSSDFYFHTGWLNTLSTWQILGVWAKTRIN